MTRTPLAIAFLTGALVLCAAGATAPVDVAGAALAPSSPRRAARPGCAFNLHLGDGIIRLRIRGGESCRTAVTVEITLLRRVGQLLTLSQPLRING
jgi:hypothetical protein